MSDLKILKTESGQQVVDYEYAKGIIEQQQGKNPNDWPERGEVVEVYVSNADYWAKVKVLAVDGGNVVWRNGSDGLSYIGTPLEYVRPIRTERDVLVEKLSKAINDSDRGVYTNLSTRLVGVLANYLIENNWRPVKQQTEDEFANYAMKNWLGVLSAHEWRDLYRAGCRFMEVGE